MKETCGISSCRRSLFTGLDEGSGDCVGLGPEGTSLFTRGDERFEAVWD